MTLIIFCILKWLMTLFLLMNASDLHLQNVPGDPLILLKRVLFL
jgi:hypothetical protein